ncbi:unnamed protein product, partial [marine sediment metagenome]
MAKNNSISLRLEGDKITSDNFSESIHAFYEFVNEVAFKVFGRRHPIKWIVNVDKGSIALKNRPELAKDLDIAKQDEFFVSIQNGIDILGKEAKYPTHFNDTAMENLKYLASLPNKKDGLTKIDIIIDDRKNTLTQHIIANVDTLINVYNEAMSSITGRLYTITERGRRHIVVYNDRTLKAVYCYIKSDELLQYALKAFGKRVYVYGLVSYLRNRLHFLIFITYL